MLLTDDVFRGNFLLILKIGGVVLDWTYIKNWGGSLGLDLYYPLPFFVFNHRLKIFGWNVLGEIAATY